MNVVFFGFTGLGNAVLRGLLKTADVAVSSVFTKKYTNPYPYYNEIQIEDFCKQEKIVCHTDVKINSEEGLSLIVNDKPDLIVVASFGQIISNQVIQIPKLGIINVHPSLLPKYRGPYPEQAVLLNNEPETGVTIHYLTKDIDAGNMIIQKSISILSEDNYTKLKKKLADLSEALILNAVKLFESGTIPAGVEQKESEATYFTKPKKEDSFLEDDSNIDVIKNKIRALNPFPGTSMLVNNERIYVDDYEFIGNKDAEGIFESDSFIDVYKNSRGIRLFKKK